MEHSWVTWKQFGAVTSCRWGLSGRTEARRRQGPVAPPTEEGALLVPYQCPATLSFFGLAPLSLLSGFLPAGLWVVSSHTHAEHSSAEYSGGTFADLRTSFSS